VKVYGDTNDRIPFYWPFLSSAVTKPEINLTRLARSIKAVQRRPAGIRPSACGMSRSPSERLVAIAAQRADRRCWMRFWLGDGLAGHLAGPLPVGAVQDARVGVAAAVGPAASDVPLERVIDAAASSCRAAASNVAVRRGSASSRSKASNRPGRPGSAAVAASATVRCSRPAASARAVVTSRASTLTPAA
jgi:hypothetical protein